MAAGRMPLEEAEGRWVMRSSPSPAATAVLTTELYHLDNRHLRVSLADRTCLALAMNRGLPVYMADRVGAELEIGAKIQTMRQGREDAGYRCAQRRPD